VALNLHSLGSRNPLFAKQTDHLSQATAAVSKLAIELRIPVAVYSYRSLDPISGYINYKPRLSELVQGLSGDLRSYCPSSREPESTKEWIYHHIQSLSGKDVSWDSIETKISGFQYQISCIHSWELDH
jgi:hypothetical protein